jgi:predicted enzyme related to lactoylglutathione lyase
VPCGQERALVTVVPEGQNAAMAATVTGVGAVVLFVRDTTASVDFYRSLGVPLEREDHGDGVAHFAAEIGGTHFAVFPSDGIGTAPALGESGCSFVGLAVRSVHAAVDAATAAGARVLQPAVEYPWGLRAVLSDPDGRPVEVFEPGQ